MGNYSFGNYICALREKKGLSQSQLGEKLGVTNKAVSRWENGGAYPSTELMLPLAKALGVSIEDLYNAITEDKAPKTKLRLILEWFMHHSKIITIICLSLVMIQYGLFVCFSNVEDKLILAIMAPIDSGIFYTIAYFMFSLFKKNPFASAKLIDFYTMFFMCFMTLSAFLMLKDFIFYFPNGFYMTSPIPCMIIMGITRGLKRRYCSLK